MIAISARELLCDLGYEDSVVFENPDYEDAIVGVTIDGNVVYDYDLMILSLVNEGMTAEEAIEFIDYNTARVLPYIGENAPVIMISLFERGE